MEQSGSIAKPSATPGMRGPLLAVLDLGTNNCRLLIATPGGRDSFRILDSFSRIVRLGEGVAATGRLSEPAMDRTIAALKICGERIARRGVVHVRAIATQACRLAANAGELVARAHDEAGLTLEIVSPQEEARLAALGCAPLIGRHFSGALVIDIGGGSTEIIWLKRDSGATRTLYATSLPLGVVSLSESFPDAAALRDEVEARIAPAHAQAQAIAPYEPEAYHLLGTSGTVTTLAAIAFDLPRYNRARVDASWHDTAHILAIADRISQESPAALARIGCIGPERADLMAAGCAIFAGICAHWPSPRLRVADRGLREGMLRELLTKVQA